MKFKFILIIGTLLYSIFGFATTSFPQKNNDALVVSAQQLATEAGMSILQKGGNAVDAAVATGYALAVVYPCCGNIGGGGFMLIHFANGKSTFINFREKAPLAAKPKFFLDANGNPDKNKLSYGYTAVGVPGTVMGFNTALKNYGTMPLADVMQPAIDLAKNGFVLTKKDAAILGQGMDAFQQQTNVAKIFLKNDMSYQAGDRLIQEDLAKTLTGIAQHGTQFFYNGRIADEIVKASQDNHGLLTKQDFNQYTVTEENPLSCNYRGYNVITTPPPGSGATICEILNIVSGYPLNKYGFHSVMATHYTVEAMRYAYADRNMYLGDPNFINIPTAHLISPRYAATIRHKIANNKAGDSRKIGFVQAWPAQGHDTTAYVVVDKWGNAVSVTYTINGYFGAKVIADKTGFFLNDELDDFTIKSGTPNQFGLVQGEANLIAPGKRPLSSMSPTIITKNHNIYMAVAGPGGSTIITQLVQTIQNSIDFGMNVQAAILAPRYHMQWLPDIVFMEPNAFSDSVLKKLKTMGYTLKSGSPWGSMHWGMVTGIVKNVKTGSLQGGLDNRDRDISDLGVK